MAKRTCSGRHLVDDEDKEEGERQATEINDNLVKECMENRRVKPALYPRALGIDIFTDNEALNKLHKQH